jgi:hypothetical protein
MVPGGIGVGPLDLPVDEDARRRIEPVGFQNSAVGVDLRV